MQAIQENAAGKVLFTAGQVAQLVSISERTIRQNFYDGKLPGYKIGSLLRFSRAQIDVWLRIFEPEAAA